MPPPDRIWRAADLGAGMGPRSVGQTGVQTRARRRRGRPGSGRRRRVRGVALDAEVERPEAAQDEEAVERAGHGAHRVLEEAQPLGDRVVES